MAAAESVTASLENEAAYDAAHAETVFQKKCSMCHAASLVEKAHPSSADEVKDLISRMVEEGLTARERDIALLVRYLTERYVKDKTQ